MNKIIFLIGIGGFIGSIFRYYLQHIISRFFPTLFPLGTLAVNILGCLVIGLIYGLSERGNVLSPEWRLFLATGLAGGFTTFSTFSIESIQLIKDGQWFSVSLYIAISVIVGIMATFLGLIIIKSL